MCAKQTLHYLNLILILFQRILVKCNIFNTNQSCVNQRYELKNIISVTLNYDLSKELCPFGSYIAEIEALLGLKNSN